ncbi:MAG TPA: hypothetical protein PLY93_04880 [Turneriella sp.]|nr:hypothetical protein [Turneriella sp.]
MKKRNRFIFIFTALLFVGGIFYLNADTSAKKDIRNVSEIFNIDEPYSFIAAVGDVPAFVEALRTGDAMRAFFDSPLGLHFIRSAPTRAAAHLHRYIAMAPQSWQWNLYALFIHGPVFYRSTRSQFVLMVQLNKKGKLVSSLMKLGNAARVGDWLIVASDNAALKAQQDYLQKPQIKNFILDDYLRDKASLSFVVGEQGTTRKKRSLFRALIHEMLGIQSFNACVFRVRPVANAVTMNGSCPNAAVNTVAKSEILNTPHSPFTAYAFRIGAPKADVVAFSGFTTEYKLIPQLFYSGSTQHKSVLEFLSQAFKTNTHQVHAIENGFQIQYPLAYAYGDKKFYQFSPLLTADNERFYWQSCDLALPKQQVAIDATNQFFVKVAIAPLIKNSLDAINAIDVIYSPAHFYEFRDALIKSMPSLTDATIQVSAKIQNKGLRIDGTLNFAKQ